MLFYLSSLERKIFGKLKQTQLSHLGRIPFETFQEEEYLEEASRTPPIPVQMEQKLFYSGINVQSPSETITIIPAIPALPAIPLSEVE